MSNPDPQGYAAAYETYRQAGWVGILPIKTGTKWPPPSIKENGKTVTSYTGYAGVDPSYPDLMQWAETRGGDNLCLRLPDGVIGIDVDAYGAKTGAAALAEATRRWGPLPPTVRSTSRGDGVSGIRLYRVPPGTRLSESINFPNLGIGDIEVCQYHHRYVMCWPSIHPEGGEYRWVDEQGKLVGVPLLALLPELPAEWIAGLPAAAPSGELVGVAYDVQNALTDGELSQAVRDRLQGAIKELSTPGVTRHDIARKHSLAMLHLGKSGEPGVKAALETFGAVFVAMIKTDRDGGEEEATHEYRSMVLGPGAAKSLSKTGFMDRINNYLDDDPPKDDAAPARTQKPERTLEAPGAATPNATLPLVLPAIGGHLAEIERGFWDSRESLRMVYQTSMARLSPPWSVLCFCAARALTMVRPNVTLPPLIGGAGSLNWFGALVAESSGGKTTSLGAAEHLVPGYLTEGFAGSGEGILAEYGRPDEEGVPENEAVMFIVDEIDSLFSMNGRSGSTTMSILRSGFSGTSTGFSYAAKDKKRRLRKHSYRMTMVCGVQPMRAGWLLSDASGGTPQRFMWFPAKDARISADRPWESSPLELPKPGEFQYPRQLVLPPEAEKLIVDEQVKRQQGVVDALDGHAVYCREKFAYALTILDGRTEMNSEDWELSGIAADISTYTREMVIDTVHAALRQDAAERGVLRGVENEAADVEKLHAQIKRGQRVLKWVLHKLDAADGGRLSQKKLVEGIAGRDRPTLHQILTAGHATLTSEPVDGTLWWSRAK